MLDNTITLSVDKANNASPVSEVFTRWEEFQNRSTYTGDDHSFAVRNTMQVYRSFPLKSGNFRGQQKATVKFTRDTTVPGVDSTNLVTPAILEINFSVPVGISDALIIEMAQYALSFLDTSALVLRVVKQLEI